MVKKTAFVLAVNVLMISLSPSAGMCWGPYRSGSHHGHHGHHGDEALLWGLGGLLLGTAILAAILPPPPPRPVVYMQPPMPVYTYPPDVPPGMCRWERYVLDSYGRTVLDRYGQPIMEYAIGSCQYPPN